VERRRRSFSARRETARRTYRATFSDSSYRRGDSDSGEEMRNGALFVVPVVVAVVVATPASSFFRLACTAGHGLNRRTDLTKNEHEIDPLVCAVASPTPTSTRIRGDGSADAPGFLPIYGVF